LLIHPLRRAAVFGLIALLVAVFPANVYMTAEPGRFADLGISYWILLVRLPLQPALATWVWWVGKT
jgi:uncharacterized membrane protein